MPVVCPDCHDAPRRTRRGEERDARLRARASELFLERGYDGVSVDDIVREVGGSKSNVYSFYGGKDGLFLAVMAEITVEMVSPLKRLQLQGLSFADGLAAFSRALLSVLLEERHLAFQRLLVTEAMRHPQLGSTWYQNGPQLARGVLRNFLAEHQARGNIRADVDLTQAAVLLDDMIVGDLWIRAMMGVGGGPQPDDVEQTIRHAVEMATRGLAPAGSGGA
ncbi:MAG TPA: TetR/AcrR family transcriptional regulator [Rhodopila sp.]|jgi:AcrR family transcriptional regulator|nr:TetR/AcrR family transcriptional regulator [Rhodopila sp.]